LRADHARHLHLERRVDTISTGLPAGAAGGNLIPLDLDAGRYIDALRARTVVIAAGAQTITDLVGNLDIPRMSRTAQVAWFNEGDDIIASDEGYDRVSFRPRHCGAIVTYSRNMLLQSTPAIEMVIRDDLSKLLAQDLDRVALTGSGQGPEPLGICRNPAVVATPAAAFGYLQNVAMRQQLGGKNVPLESLAWVGNSQIDSWSLSVLDGMSRPLGKQLVYLNIPDFVSNIVHAPAVVGPPALPVLTNPLVLGAFSPFKASSPTVVRVSRRVLGPICTCLPKVRVPVCGASSRGCKWRWVPGCASSPDLLRSAVTGSSSARPWGPAISPERSSPARPIGARTLPAS
jgi:Phage capsid family